MQHWLIRCAFLLGVFKLSYPLECPFAKQQLSFAASNAIGSEKAHLFPETLNTSPLQHGADHNDGFYDNLFGKDSDNSLYNSLEHEAKFHCAVPPLSCANETSNLYYRTFDGSCNNLAHPGYGIANSRFGRFLKPKYGDGVYTPSRSQSGAELPNPRLLSLALYGDQTVADDTLTLWTMQWGQFLGHDISEQLLSGVDNCCENPHQKHCYPIPLHVYGPITLSTGKTCLDFARSLSDKDVPCLPDNLGYAEKLTKQTPFFDLSSLYGNSLEQSIKVRHYQGGLLRTTWHNHQQYLTITPSSEGECLPGVEECYRIPDIRNQLAPTIAALHTLLVREHNRLATILEKLNPHYSDEKIFQLARKINVAQYQKIIYYDWLPLVLGSDFAYAHHLIHNVRPHDYVNDYDPSWKPTAYAESAAAALRYGHTTVPGFFSLVAPDYHHNKTLRLSDYFKRQETISLIQTGNNLDDLFRGLQLQMQKRTDRNIDKDLKHSFEHQPFEEYGSDLKSIDIQRSRDFGLASYNDYREACGLPRAYAWSDFEHELPSDSIALLQKFYKSPNDVDLSVGGSLEKHLPEGIFGPTFQCILGRQFVNLRKSDRFFFEHFEPQAGFTREQLAEIRKVSLASLLCANSVSLKHVQPNVFVYPNEENQLVNCNSLPQLNLKLWQENGAY
ncbi:peroxidase-like [Musca autumnalis]|uniref:peroxidase-like n=1 Tax=Musca autumnalis TaxID=221902 RepID=UPI003CED1DA7